MACQEAQRFLLKLGSFVLFAAVSACAGGPGVMTTQETQIYGPLSADEKELLGPDQDGNGVRDDVDAWIARKFPDATHRTQLTNSAQWMTWSILRGARGNPTSRQELNDWSSAISCLNINAFKQPPGVTPSMVDLKNVILNSYIRTKNYLKWDASTSGMPSRTSAKPCLSVVKVGAP
jgi:hypothetical protein